MPVCPSCGQQNPDGFRFCGACGAELATTSAREVRKMVTVLFADVSGSTALGEQIDPESFRHVMARYFETAKRCLERHGGTVEKFIGDAVMAVFGVPAMHEDDALRALRAAAELRHSLASLNEELEHDYGVSVQIRIGVNTGEVAFSPDSKLLAGVRSEPTPYVHVWALDVDRLLAIARGRVTRSLTDAECRRYLQGPCP